MFLYVDASGLPICVSLRVFAMCSPNHKPRRTARVSVAAAAMSLKKGRKEFRQLFCFSDVDNLVKNQVRE